MAFLVVGGITVPVAIDDGADNDIEEIGDRGRAFDGTMLSAVRGRKSQWPIRTTPMKLADKDALRAVLEGAPPIPCSGDLLGGATNCVAVVVSDKPVTVADGRRYVLHFELHEV